MPVQRAEDVVGWRPGANRFLVRYLDIGNAVVRIEGWSQRTEIIDGRANVLDHLVQGDKRERAGVRGEGNPVVHALETARAREMRGSHRIGLDRRHAPATAAPLHEACRKHAEPGADIERLPGAV